MRLTVKQLRARISEELELEWAGAPPNKQEPFVGDSHGSAWNSREQLDSLKKSDVDTETGDELPPHLREPMYDAEDCFGPVPPDQPEPHIQTDPFARDFSPKPNSSIRRG